MATGPSGNFSTWAPMAVRMSSELLWGCTLATLGCRSFQLSVLSPEKKACDGAHRFFSFFKIILFCFSFFN